MLASRNLASRSLAPRQSARCQQVPSRCVRARVVSPPLTHPQPADDDDFKAHSDGMAALRAAIYMNIPAMSLSVDGAEPFKPSEPAFDELMRAEAPGFTIPLMDEATGLSKHMTAAEVSIAQMFTGPGYDGHEWNLLTVLAAPYLFGSPLLRCVVSSVSEFDAITAACLAAGRPFAIIMVSAAAWARYGSRITEAMAVAHQTPRGMRLILVPLQEDFHDRATAAWKAVPNCVGALELEETFGWDVALASFSTRNQSTYVPRSCPSIVVGGVHMITSASHSDAALRVPMGQPVGIDKIERHLSHHATEAEQRHRWEADKRAAKNPTATSPTPVAAAAATPLTSPMSYSPSTSTTAASVPAAAVSSPSPAVAATPALEWPPAAMSQCMTSDEIKRHVPSSFADFVTGLLAYRAAGHLVALYLVSVEALRSKQSQQDYNDLIRRTMRPCGTGQAGQVRSIVVPLGEGFQQRAQAAHQALPDHWRCGPTSRPMAEWLAAHYGLDVALASYFVPLGERCSRGFVPACVPSLLVGGGYLDSFHATEGALESGIADPLPAWRMRQGLDLHVFRQLSFRAGEKGEEEEAEGEGEGLETGKEGGAVAVMAEEAVVLFV